MGDKIAIVGAGIGGLSLAYRLVKSGQCPDVYEQQPRLCDNKPGPPFGREPVSASECAQGVATVKGLKEAYTPLFRAKLDGHTDFLDMMRDVAGSKFHHLIKFGVMEPFASLEEHQKVLDRVYRGKFLGPFDVEVLSRWEIEQRHPGIHAKLQPTQLGGFWYPKDYFYDAVSCLEAIKAWLIQRSVVFIQKQIKQIIKQDDDQFRLGSGHQKPYAKVVLCCSTGTNDLLQNSFGRYIKIKEKMGASLEIRHEVSEKKKSGATPKKTPTLLEQSPATWPYASFKQGTKSINLFGRFIRVGAVDHSMPSSINNTQDAQNDWQDTIQTDKTDHSDIPLSIESLSRFIDAVVDVRGFLPCAKNVASNLIQKHGNEGPRSMKGIKDIKNTGKSKTTATKTSYGQASWKVLKGVRVQGPKSLPLVGPLGEPRDFGNNLWIMSGFYKSGYALAPYFSKLIAPELLNTETGHRGTLKSAVESAVERPIEGAVEAKAKAAHPLVRSTLLINNLD